MRTRGSRAGSAAPRFGFRFVGAAGAEPKASGTTPPSRTTATVSQKLRDEGLEPFVTLHHNTWPVHVENRGGMVARDFPVWFAAYAREVATRLGDLITYYVTHQRAQPARVRLHQAVVVARVPDAAGLAAGRRHRSRSARSRS